MKITSLVENTTNNPSFETEHGLSLYIETATHSILFDMGQTSLFASNAENLGLDLRKVDIAILSHGHYDHGGGLKSFLSINDIAPVYISQHAFKPYYNGTNKYIGLDTSLRESKRLIFTKEVKKIDSSLSLFSCNEHTKLYNLGSFGLTKKEGDLYLPDDFCHEQYLLIEENNKKVLISGCSHKGILDIVNWFDPDILIGGFHFSKLPLDETLTDYAKTLNNYKTKFFTCHCTGLDQYSYMQNYMNNLHYLATGETLEL